MKLLADIVSFFANLFTIGASGIAIYLFIWKRDAITSVFHMLVNYSYQLSLSELKEKLERLNDYNANESSNVEVIINIFHEFLGQVRGNDKLKVIMKDQVQKVEDFINRHQKGRPITEPAKRALVSEIREKLRHLNVQTIDQFVGGGA